MIGDASQYAASKGLTIEKVIELSGVSRRTLNNWASGDKYQQFKAVVDGCVGKESRTAYRTTDEMLDAVLDNNCINDGKWSDWDGVWHILDTYRCQCQRDDPAYVPNWADDVLKKEGEALEEMQTVLNKIVAVEKKAGIEVANVYARGLV